MTANASFVGTDAADVDVDAPMSLAVLREIAQDIELCRNIATGEGSPPITLDHAVNNGAPLGIPLVNQVINRQLAMSTTDASTYGGDTYLWGAPIFFPENGAYYEASLYSDWGGTMDLVVLSATGTVEQTIGMTRVETDNGACMRCFFQVSTTAALRFVLLRISASRAYDVYLDTFALYRLPPAMQRLSEQVEDIVSAELDLPQVTAAGTAIMKANHYPLDNWFTSNYSVNSVLLKRLRDFICKCYEYTHGWPAAGNRVVTDEDSDDNDPATSRFMAHTRATYATEPLIDFPLVAEGLGACRTDGANTTNSGSTLGLGGTRWHAPWVVTASTNVVFHEVVGYAPDFPTAATLKGCILFAGSAGSPGKVQGRITLVGGSSVTDATATSLGSNLYCLNFSGVDFDADILNVWQFELNTNGAFTFNEANILGVCLYFEP